MHNYFYLSHSKIGNIYVMYIDLLGRHYDVNLFQPQGFVSRLSLPSLSIFWTVSRQSAAAISASPGCLYRLELHLDRLFLVYQQGFFLSAGLFKKIWVLSSPTFQVALSVLSSSFWTHETWLVYNHCQTHSIQTVII